MAVNYAKNRQTLKKANDLHHNQDHAAFREVKTESFYPFGRKKGAGLLPTDEYREGWDRVFGKKDEPEDFDSRK